MPYYEKRIKSGRLLEIEQYFATKSDKPSQRSAKEDESGKGQVERNNRNAMKSLMRWINTNFDGRRGDMFITLTHDRGTSEIEARRISRNFLARVRRRAKKLGVVLKYIIIDETQGQPHHHIIMNAMPWDVLKELWTGRRIHISTLDRIDNYKDLAGYLVREDKPDADGENTKERRKKGKRRWSGSRNLEAPDIDVKEITRIRIGKQPKPPRGYRLINDWHMGCDFNGNLFLYYVCVKEDERQDNRAGRKGKKQKGGKGHGAN